MRRFASSTWSAICLVDGRYLEGDVWDHPSDTLIKRHLYRKSEQEGDFRGDLTFAPAVSRLTVNEG
jgi:hypothetical protein